MSLSYVFRATPFAAPLEARRVLITGAAGRIGSAFAEYAHRRYRLSLTIRPGGDGAALKAYGDVVEASLGDLDQLKGAFAGQDTIVHLAGDPDPDATWQDLLEANIIGTYHAMVAAKAAGCRRLIYASSIHAVSGYPTDVQVKTTEPVNPGDLYGVTKCFGEALGRYMAGKENLSVIALRIGAFEVPETAHDPEAIGMMGYFLSHRDLCQLICRCIDDVRLQFGLFQAVSDNRFKRLDISDTRELTGYQPQDDFARESPELAALKLEERVVPSAQKSGLREELEPGVEGDAP